MTKLVTLQLKWLILSRFDILNVAQRIVRWWM